MIRQLQHFKKDDYPVGAVRLPCTFLSVVIWLALTSVSCTLDSCWKNSEFVFQVAGVADYLSRCISTKLKIYHHFFQQTNYTVSMWANFYIWLENKRTIIVKLQVPVYLFHHTIWKKKQVFHWKLKDTDLAISIVVISRRMLGISKIYWIMFWEERLVERRKRQPFLKKDE